MVRRKRTFHGSYSQLGHRGGRFSNVMMKIDGGGSSLISTISVSGVRLVFIGNI